MIVTLEDIIIWFNEKRINAIHNLQDKCVILKPDKDCIN